MLHSTSARAEGQRFDVSRGTGGIRTPPLYFQRKGPSRFCGQGLDLG